MSARLNSVQILQLLLIMDLITGKYPEIMDRLEVRCLLQLELRRCVKFSAGVTSLRALDVVGSLAKCFPISLIFRVFLNSHGVMKCL